MVAVAVGAEETDMGEAAPVVDTAEAAVPKARMIITIVMSMKHRRVIARRHLRMEMGITSRQRLAPYPKPRQVLVGMNAEGRMGTDSEVIDPEMPPFSLRVINE